MHQVHKIRKTNFYYILSSKIMGHNNKYTGNYLEKKILHLMKISVTKSFFSMHYKRSLELLVCNHKEFLIMKGNLYASFLYVF